MDILFVSSPLVEVMKWSNFYFIGNIVEEPVQLGLEP